jgi:hypothetical protein
VKLPVAGVQCCWFLDEIQPRPECRFFQVAVLLNIFLKLPERKAFMMCTSPGPVHLWTRPLIKL